MLSDVNFLNSYSSGYVEPKEFFTEALIESSTFDLGLGFFSSSGIRSLAYGFAIFIANGGKMRVVINDILSDDDKRAILIGQSQSISDKLCERIITDIQKMKATFSKADELFFRCFAYLISVKRIEFIATLSAHGGLAHDKYGVFTDKANNKVAFIGSANFSQTAFEINSETVTVFTSQNDSKRIEEYQSMFNTSWTKDTPHLIHIPIDRVKAYVQNDFKTSSAIELIKAGISLRDLDQSSIKGKPLSSELIEKLEQKEQEPRFPFPSERKPQIDAYNAWVNNNRQGIFAMATGTGKTVTALNCVLKDYEQKKLQAELDSEKRKEELYQKIPRLQEIEEELNHFAISTAKNILFHPSASLEDLTQKVEKLKQEKIDILQKAKLPSDYLNPKYSCSYSPSVFGLHCCESVKSGVR